MVGEFGFKLVVLLVIVQLVMFIAIIFMHFLMPKNILDKYFKPPPYFREAECKLFTGIPYAPMRTIMLMAVIAFPSRGKKRKMVNVYKLSPGWYRIASIIILWTSAMLAIIIPAMIFGLYLSTIL